MGVTSLADGGTWGVEKLALIPGSTVACRTFTCGGWAFLFMRCHSYKYNNNDASHNSAMCFLNNERVL